MSAKLAAVKALTVIIILLSIGHFVSSIMISRNCYVKPCYEGHGLELLWSVNIGRSFRLIVFSLINIATSLYVARGLFGSPQGRKLGLLIGALFAMGFFMGFFTFSATAATGMISNLNAHLNGEYFKQPTELCLQGNANRTSCGEIKNCVWDDVGSTGDTRCVRGMLVDLEMSTKFKILAIFCGLLGSIQLFTAFLIYTWRQAIIYGSQFSSPFLDAETTEYKSIQRRENLD
eukprot:c7501_g1_i1.p1 GENE.c7501_g1_i1~~c7501_g1_i1.p1  ORF type:complete len:242 (+),score=69.46 c7501_g1_i1:33-728(+)